MRRRSGTIHINKLAAAIRQLNAAIRMFFASEDDLAIHTVATAAFRILRDLTEKRGKNFTAEVLKHGLHAMARQPARDKLPKQTFNLIQDAPLMQALRKIGAQSEGFDVDRIQIRMNRTGEQRAWPSKASNFLRAHPGSLDS